MNFSRYYDSTCFTANKMHTRAIMPIVNIEYMPPPDIQLFYLLEIIENFAALGQTTLQLNSCGIEINNNVFTKLYELGYTIETNDNNVTIRWDY